MGGGTKQAPPQWNNGPSAKTWLGDGQPPDQRHGGEQDNALNTPKMTAPVAEWRGKTPRGTKAEVTNQYMAFQGNKGRGGTSKIT